MYRKKFRPQPISTHGLEEDLDRSYASLQSQVDILEKLQKIFGENPTDPVIAFQLKKIKEGLTRDVRKLALTGTDLHQLQEQFGADVVRGQIINARQIINQEKEGHNGQLTDMINDDQIGRAYQDQQLKLNPLEKAKMAEHVRTNIVNDEQRQALAQHYVNQGMKPDQADKKATAQFLKHGLSDQDRALLDLIEKGSAQLNDQQIKELLRKAEETDEHFTQMLQPIAEQREQEKEQREEVIIERAKQERKQRKKYAKKMQPKAELVELIEEQKAQIAAMRAAQKKDPNEDEPEEEEGGEEEQEKGEELKYSEEIGYVNPDWNKTRLNKVEGHEKVAKVWQDLQIKNKKGEVVTGLTLKRYIKEFDHPNDALKSFEILSKKKGDTQQQAKIAYDFVKLLLTALPRGQRQPKPDKEMFPQ